MLDVIKRVFLLFVAVGGTICPSDAITIPVDLGAPRRVTGEQHFFFPTGLDGSQLHGQTMTFDFVFNSFVRLFPETSKTFILIPFLTVQGGPAESDLPEGTGHLIGLNGTVVPAVTSFGGSVIGAPPHIGLGAFFPLLADANGNPNPNVIFPLDIYGAHLAVTLPDGVPPFTVTGGEFGLFPDGIKPSQNIFQIGDLPDNGATLSLALAAFGLLFIFHAKATRAGRA